MSLWWEIGIGVLAVAGIFVPWFVLTWLFWYGWGLTDWPFRRR